MNFNAPASRTALHRRNLRREPGNALRQVGFQILTVKPQVIDLQKTKGESVSAQPTERLREPAMTDSRRLLVTVTATLNIAMAGLPWLTFDTEAQSMTARKPHAGLAAIASNLHVAEHCRAVSELLARVGDKWPVQVVGVLGDGPKRLSEIRRPLGSISQRMLTLTLRGLERDGPVTRTVIPTIAPRVDYEVRKVGRSLLEPVNGLSLWVRTNRAVIEDARQRFGAGEKHR